jgi:excisionase family DNA binding protein
MIMAKKTPTLTTSEAAERSGVSVRAIRTAITRGELTASKEGRSLVIAEADLTAWLAGRGTTEAAATPAAGGNRAIEALVVEDERPFVLHLGYDGWNDIEDRPSSPERDGVHAVRVAADEVAGRGQINYTRFYPDENRWEGQDHLVAL